MKASEAGALSDAYNNRNIFNDAVYLKLTNSIYYIIEYVAASGGREIDVSFKEELTLLQDIDRFNYNEFSGYTNKLVAELKANGFKVYPCSTAFSKDTIAW